VARAATHRACRDQNVITKTFTDTAGVDDGGRKGDVGAGWFRSNSLTAGQPGVRLRSRHHLGTFAAKWNEFWQTPFYYFVDPTAAGIGPLAPTRRS